MQQPLFWGKSGLAVVLVFAIVFGSIGYYYLFGGSGPDRIGRTRSKMMVVEQAVEAYKENHGAPPPNLETLLQPDPANGNYPYFKEPKHIRDSWGHVFGYDPADKDGPLLWFRLSDGRVYSNRPPPDDPIR